MCLPFWRLELHTIMQGVSPEGKLMIHRGSQSWSRNSIFDNFRFVSEFPLIRQTDSRRIRAVTPKKYVLAITVDLTFRRKLLYAQQSRQIVAKSFKKKKKKNNGTNLNFSQEIRGANSTRVYY